ncbi:MAG: ABC transporter ATP-binding protein [Longimonas sp.]|uniref:ABC transporter ATP-binding protein n=1 Tax=Longimonas sp. TaxID=2039626 RepID=UPI00334DCFBF
MSAAIAVDGLCKTYRSGLFRNKTVEALRGIDLTVGRGHVFGLLGPNGAGKTTLVKILLGIVHPTAGDAHLFDVPATRAEARTRVGYLPEKHTFPGLLTATQMLDLYGRMGRVSTAERATRIPELLEKVGLSAQADRKINTFSKGMLQRVGIAQALLNNPDLLFLDEPTDGVDPVGRRDIRDLLVWLRDEGTTIFINSHLLSEVEKVCGEVAIMNEGELVRQGGIGQLTSVEREYRITCTPLPDSLPGAAASQMMRVDEAPAPELEQWRVAAETRTDLNALLDTLRSHNVELEAVEPVRRSLEDYFIDVVSPPSA